MKLPIKEERKVPEICLKCGNYHPTFWRIVNKECAAFVTCDGVKDNRCGAFCKKVELRTPEQQMKHGPF